MNNQKNQTQKSQDLESYESITWYVEFKDNTIMDTSLILQNLRTDIIFITKLYGVYFFESFNLKKLYSNRYSYLKKC